MDADANPAYRLTWETDHLEQLSVDYDIHLTSEEWTYETLVVYETQPPTGLPLPVRFEAAHGLVPLLDYPVPSSATSGWPIVSKRMLEVLRSFTGFQCNPIAISIEGVNTDYYCIQLTRLEDDSAYNTKNSDRLGSPVEDDDTDEQVSLEPNFDYPPLFRLQSDPIPLFVSAKARAAFNAAGIRGVAYREVNSFEVEVDQVLALPTQSHILQ